ncbi:di-heme-cytochrome C peroxidase [Methylobacterium indicum]|uniref:di-heme-cytochrome C peroxidase n=1 Tax=Methylobacterium indicum TaxID=1775910 RepID=UPI000AEF8747|nr:di-heme-cytochrome C peroxidase [Methylobacterium indicum]
MGTGRLAKIIVGLVAVVLIVVGIGFKIYRDKLYVALPDYPPVKAARWLGQAWSNDEQDWYHHADQGTQTLNIPYEWFIALEQPRLTLVGDVGRLADPAYLDRYGFIPGATRGGEIQLPIGFARGGDKARDQGTMLLPDGQPWLNPRTGKPTHKIGFTCAACHTGRLTYRETALLVDGGPALTDLGKFRQGLGLSVLFTKYVPGRFDRFAMNVLGEDASEADKAALRAQLDALWDRLDAVRKLDKKVSSATVDEGYGRLDALNRIGNTVFALDLDDASREANYAATTAPVNFPHVWNTSWFDWVQYNASIEQPMVRNAGEALGVSAPVNLTDPGKGLFASQVHVENIARIEKQIAGEQPDAQAGFTGLRAPRWPSLFAEVDAANAIDPDRARRGAGLYGELCQGCHQAPIGSTAFWDSKAWLPPNASGQRYLVVKTLPIGTIGTDPAQAEDMIARTVALPAPLVQALKDRREDGPGDVALGEPDKDGRYAFGPALGVTVKRTVDRWYDGQTPPTPTPDRDRLNGYRPNGIQAPAAYKARPLDGVWATPPFLHNGSVPNVFALLSPVAERPKSFTLGRREFDPVCLGYQLTAVAASRKDPRACLNAEAGAEANRLGGLFTLDTAQRGNLNTGHEFADGKGKGIIGRALSVDERMALIEFLKTDCINGVDPDPARAAASTTRCEALASAAPR